MMPETPYPVKALHQGETLAQLPITVLRVNNEVRSNV